MKSCLEWDEYEEAAYEMWDLASRQGLTGLKQMADRLRELFPEKAA